MNRNVELDFSDPALIKLVWGGRQDTSRGTPADYHAYTGGHYHTLFVRDPGGPEQVAECDPRNNNLSLICEWIDRIYLPETINEGWEASGSSDADPAAAAAARSAICRWRSGVPFWRGDAVYAAAAAADDENPYLVSDVDADESPF